MNTENMITVKRIGITSQESKKTDLIEWSYFKKEVLANHQLVATGTTADIVEGTVNIPVEKILSGAVGGYKQLTTMIEEGKLDGLIFFSDNMADYFANSDVRSLLETAIRKNIIVCFNRTTADYVFDSMLMTRSYIIEGPGYSPETTKETLLQTSDDNARIAV